MTTMWGRSWLAALLLVAAVLPSATVRAAQADQASPAATPGLTGYWNGVRDGDPVGPDDLAITRLSIEFTQRGGMVDTVIEAVLSHRNQQRDDRIEAHVAFALPDQAVVTGYALDIGGTMVAGTLLDQGKAKRVYEAEIRQGIDPGLAEVVGNRFTTRVFPIAPGGSRTVRVQFSAPADAIDGFVLPWLAAPIQGPATVRYYATATGGRPVLTLPWGRPMTIARSGIAWKGEAQAPAGTSFAAPLRIAAAAVDGPIVSRHASGQNFFELASKPVKDPAAAGPAAPERLRIYWDRSWSRSDDALDSEIALLADYLAARPASAIDLVSFAEDTPVVTTVANADELQAALAGQRYLGATRLTGLDALKLADAAQCLLFTDGARSLDPMADFAPDCRLQIIASAPDADTAWLSNLAQESGGQLILLTPESRAAALSALTRPAAGVVRVRSDSGYRLSFRSLATKGGGWHIVGPMRGQEGLSLWVVDAKGRVSIQHFDREDAGLERHNGAGALWASSEVARISDDPAQRDAMVELARKYQVAAASLAFLVLESPDQYVTADIAPPADGFDAEWREEYAELRKDKDGEAQEARDEHLEMVRNNWAERKAWHGRSFDANARAKKVDRDSANAASAGADAAAADMAPPPPSYVPAPLSVPSPAVSPAAEESSYGVIDVDAASADAAATGAEDYSADGNIIVTASRRSESLQDVPVALTAITVGDVEVKVADLLSSGPYIKALDAASPDARDAVLRDQAKLYGNLSGFWLDVAEWYRAKGETAMATRLLLTALDATTADDETRQIVAFRLERDGQIDAAVTILERFAALNAERPQPRRLLALALAKRGKAGDLERAFALLTDVALTPFNRAFEGIEVVSLMEANALIPALDRQGAAWKLAPEFVALLDTDVRLVIEWTNDDADIDLWVIEPNGERVFYSNKLSAAGGTISNDMTDGYGPEEYVVRRARAGDYKVRIHGYSPDRINPNGTGRVTVRLVRDFGRATQKEQLVDAEIGFGGDGRDGDGQDSNGRDGDGSRGIATLTVPATR